MTTQTAVEGYRFFNVHIEGLVPLILHSGQTADPLNPFAKAMKAISGKRKKTDADHEEMASIEWRAGLYVNRDNKIILPSRVIEAAVVVGAKRSKDGKTALSGMFIDSDGVLEFDGDNLSIDELMKSPKHRLTVPVRVGQARVMRTRPTFENWRTSFTVSVSTEVVTDASQLKRWIADCGAFSGIGDWRPRFGRFTVTKFEEVTQALPLAA